MFEFIKQHPLPIDPIQTDEPIITSGYFDLLYCDGPILYAGLNDRGVIVVGSSCEDDFENKEYRFIHVLVTPHHFSQFLFGKVTYLVLIELFGAYVIDVTNMGKTRTVYHVWIDNIPNEYLPTKDSYCPLIKDVQHNDFKIPMDNKNGR